MVDFSIKVKMNLGEPSAAVLFWVVNYNLGYIDSKLPQN